MRTRLVASAVLAAQIAAFGPAAAPAFAAPLSVRVLVTDAGPCPAAAAELEQKLLDRNPGWTGAAAGSIAHEARIRFGGEAGQVRGELELAEPSGESVTRSVIGVDCAEVVGALILITSVLATGSTSAHPVNTAEAVMTESDAPGAADQNHELRPAFGATLAVASGLLPFTAVFPRAFVGAELARPRALPIASLRLSFAHATAQGDVEAPDSPTAGAATVSRLALDTRLLSVRAEGCAPRLGWPEVAAEGCALLELGSLAGTARGYDTPDSNSAVWSAAGLLARLFWQPLPPLRFELEAGSFAALTGVRLRLEAPGSPTVFRSADFGVFAGLSAGLAFP
jgi:hypothetical protein